MLRVKGLLHYGLRVPSLDAGASFYSAFGLETSERGDAVVIRCDGRAQDQTVLTEGPVKRLHHVAFAVEPGSLREWQRHIEGMGLRLLDAPAEVPGGLWLRDHEGNLINPRDEGIAPWREFGTTDGQDANVGDRIRRVDQACWLTATEQARPVLSALGTC
ncbi:VOC family protein [Streptomyces sp. AC555_RSS877]|uniref:VOC family protein n=1 Tax=Streptomyces sp. AC555_RSS877 TaxID=2823688 RepID=UPI0020B7D77F|nr:VOC family protein [Streptomyces sp. AC555_RSS877]